MELLLRLAPRPHTPLGSRHDSPQRPLGSWSMSCADKAHTHAGGWFPEGRSLHMLGGTLATRPVLTSTSARTSSSPPCMPRTPSTPGTASLSLLPSRPLPSHWLGAGPGPRDRGRGGGGGGEGVCLELGVALLDPLQRLHPARARRPRAHQPARAPESGPCAHRPARAGDGRLPGPREHTRPPPLTLAVPTQARTHVPRRSKRAREGGCWRACALLAACDSRHVATPGLPGGAIGDLRLLRGPGGGGGAW